VSGHDEVAGSSGRWEPRPGPVPADFRHNVRFYGSSRGGVHAECVPCDWLIWVDDGHTAADFAELERQHCGGLQAEPAAAQPDPAAAKLAEVRLVLEQVLGDELDDRQYALEQVEQIVLGGEPR
jgi:hypothetical protein